MNERIELGRYNLLPPVVKNLLIINGLFYLAKVILKYKNIDLDLDDLFGLHYFQASKFKVWQVITYMFMHGDFWHLFFNMFALWMFGSSIENIWGSKKFIIYYLITGIGAALIHYIIIYFQINHDMLLFNQFLDLPNEENLKHLFGSVKSDEAKGILRKYIIENSSLNPDIKQISNDFVIIKDNFLNSFNIIGASGSVFGILLAFGMLFPNSVIYLYFFLPLKAKWFVIIFGVLELFYGVTGSQDGIAHFAHLGGMLFGIILILYWKKKKTLY
jgi:membrane associated rhomboid family serine protease